MTQKFSINSNSGENVRNRKAAVAALLAAVASASLIVGAAGAAQAATPTDKPVRSAITQPGIHIDRMENTVFQLRPGSDRVVDFSAENIPAVHYDGVPHAVRVLTLDKNWRPFGDVVEVTNYTIRDGRISGQLTLPPDVDPVALNITVERFFQTDLECAMGYNWILRAG